MGACRSTPLSDSMDEAVATLWGTVHISRSLLNQQPILARYPGSTVAGVHNTACEEETCRCRLASVHSLMSHVRTSWQSLAADGADDAMTVCEAADGAMSHNGAKRFDKRMQRATQGLCASEEVIAHSTSSGISASTVGRQRPDRAAVAEGGGGGDLVRLT